MHVHDLPSGIYWYCYTGISCLGNGGGGGGGWFSGCSSIPNSQGMELIYQSKSAGIMRTKRKATFLGM